ncbi:MAG: MerR family transcriptional regulator, partial [Caldilineaceae bacterium]
MLKIGEFSKLAQVSVKTLRYYDELGLFKAEWVDRYSGYRYYSLDQLPRLNRILALRDLGFSLVQIERIIREDQDVVGLCRLMELRMTELEHEVQVQQERLNRVATRLKLIQEEGHAPRYDVVSKELPSGLVAGIRDTVDGFAAIVSLAGELHSFLVRRGVSPGPLSPFTAIYFDD